MYNTLIGDDVMDILLEVLEETLPILPMLLIMYAFLEYFEKHGINLSDKLKKHGPIYGAILGIIPQCGISVVASVLFLEKKITLGTLISIYIATSDEAIPLLLTDSSLFSTTIQFIIIKCILGALFGTLIDHFVHISFERKEDIKHDEEHSLWKCIISRTLKIYIFIVVIHLLLSYLFEWIGEDQLSVILLNQSTFQPVIASIFGLIPHCVVSVVLTQLYASNLLSFASLVSGLMTNAGMGLIVLIQNKIDIKIFMRIIGLLLLCSILTGFVLNLL